jgi:NADPH-dependent 2,4-dienoyl-CoA reductase/sulfur reductase-like enzyme
MYIFMGHMRYQDTKPFEDSLWGRERLELVRDWVTAIDTDRRELSLARGAPLAFDQLLIATGSTPNKFGWPGQDLDGVQGLWGLQDLSTLNASVKRARRAVIVGGGLIGIELAEMLQSVGIGVTMLVRESSYWANILPLEESLLVNREILCHGIGLRLSTELEAVLDDGEGRARGVRTTAGEEIACEIVGLTAGVSPNLSALAGSGIETGRGVLVDNRLRTSVPGIFAAGDCAEIRTQSSGKNTIQQVWYTGKRQGEFVAQSMAGEATGDYETGLWFNSAKFLDLEYQTYGSVGLDVPGERNLYWQHESGKHALRIVYTREGVIGFDTLGQRWRHSVSERWILDRTPLRDVLANLEEAHFEPEFFRRHEADMRRSFESAL